MILDFKSKLLKELLNNIDYSVRRYFVDLFFFENQAALTTGSIIDIGGKKSNTRGLFQISLFNSNIQYVNIDPKTKPDYLCDAAKIPVEDCVFDNAILAEVLEHTQSPLSILTEAARILKPGGYLFVTVPFCYHYHADPHDFSRYTQLHLKDLLERAGFINLGFTKQGLAFAVIASILKFADKEIKNNQSSSFFLKNTIQLVSHFLLTRFQCWDSTSIVTNSKILSEYTTGFGIIAMKK